MSSTFFTGCQHINAVFGCAGTRGFGIGITRLVALEPISTICFARSCLLRFKALGPKL